MIWVRDLTGRFSERPHYKNEELDYECEGLILGFLQQHQRPKSFPIATDAITLLIEELTSDFDCYSDLTDEGERVEGVTYFYPGKKPAVRISKNLSENDPTEHRLRTTLTHELGHVKFHTFLWNVQRPKLFDTGKPQDKVICKRDTMLNASQKDWMEWQAGYASGSILMPITELRNQVSSILKAAGVIAPILIDSPVAENVISTIAGHFEVSQQAAAVRISQQGYLTRDSQTLNLLKF